MHIDQSNDYYNFFSVDSHLSNVIGCPRYLAIAKIIGVIDIGSFLGDTRNDLHVLQIAKPTQVVMHLQQYIARCSCGVVEWIPYQQALDLGPTTSDSPPPV